MQKVRKSSFKVVKGDVTKLGVCKMADGINFAIRVKGEVLPMLLLYKKGLTVVAAEISFEKAAVMGEVSAIKILHMDETQYEYNYQIGADVVQDPCARLIVGRAPFGKRSTAGGHQIRCGFDTKEYDWQGDQPLGIPYHESCMYSLHVRGFTMQSASKVRHKGTFKGLQEKIDYIKTLGFNQVKLMPAYEFEELIELGHGLETKYMDLSAEAEKVNFWGYGPGYYFAPKYSYAASANPAEEFRDMVLAMHQAGIEVIMEFQFTPDVDYRMAAECLFYWHQEYHIDGFCLLGNAELAVLLAKDPLFTSVKLMGAYFEKEAIYPGNEVPAVKNLGEYNDGFKVDIRRLLKGDAHQLGAFAYRSKRNPDYCGVINYVANHDGFTLNDMVSYEERHNEENGEQNQDGAVCNETWNCGAEGPSRKRAIQELRKRQIKNALAMLFLSTGTPMLMAGDEIGNSQKGNNNPYCQDNEIGWVDWKASKRNAEIYEFVKTVMAFRKEHKILHTEKELRGMDTRSCGYPDLSYHGKRAWYGDFESGKRHVGMMYCGEYAKESCFIYVAYNFHHTAHTFALPHLPGGMTWRVAIDTQSGVGAESDAKVLEKQKEFSVPGRTVLVLKGSK